MAVCITLDVSRPLNNLEFKTSYTSPVSQAPNMLANSITAFAQLAVLAAVARAAHHEVAVGKDKQLKFVPETLNAAIGDTITYSFFAKVIGNVR